MKFFYGSYLIVFLIKYTIQSNNDLEFEFEYIPPSREIEVIEDDDYTFGIIEDIITTNVTKCYYTTDTGISDYFNVTNKPQPTTTTVSTEANVLFKNEVGHTTPGYQSFHPPENDRETRVIYNEITHMGQSGRCQMTIKWVNADGPTKWTLIPHNDSGKIFSPIEYKINFFYRPKLLMPSITIYQSDSFFQYLNESINFKSCILTFSDTKVELALHSTRTNSFSTPYSKVDEETVKKISSFGHGFCGFRLDNATAAETREWTITATDNEGKRYRESFKSMILKKIDPSILHTKRFVTLGDRTIIECGETYSQKFCTMYNPSGNVVYTETLSHCIYSIPTTSLDDIGVWKCIAGKESGMVPATYTVELIIKSKIEDKPVEIWANETDSTLNIGCRIINYDSNGISFCKITAPNHDIINPRVGVATGRYLSFGTNFKHAICAIEIQKPIQDYENGLWQCEIITGGSFMGDFINVGTTTVPDYPKQINVTLQLEQPYQIQCQVPYSSEYCHIKGPDGTIYQAKDSKEPLVGKCSLTPMVVNATHNGTWTCSFARTTGLSDEEIHIEITVAEVFQYYRMAEVSVGNKAELMCKSGGLPFKYCRFISPNGKAYQITNHQQTDTISYYGKGLEYGECGISITNAQTLDNGYWTCVARIGSDYRQSEIKAQIMLEVIPSLFDDPNIAATVGIAVGVVVVTSIIGIVVLQKWRRRRHSEVPGSTIRARSLNDNEDNNSENIDIFSVAPVPRSYTNPVVEGMEDVSHAHQL